MISLSTDVFFGESYLYFHDDGGQLREIPALWTDFVRGDVFVEMAAGRSTLNADSLLELVDLLERMAVCPLTSGFDSAHTFFSVDAGGNPITTVTGAAGNTLTDGTGAASSVNANNPRPGSLAVDPCATNAPAWAQSGCITIVSPPVYLFSRSRKGSSDPILLFDHNDTNDARDLRLVQDLCPACKNQATQQSSAAAHIDMYNGTSKSCGAGVVGDYGYYYAIRLR
ncbi:MAG: hypothetical protein JWQ49_6233 [Edaphobacter sp.]|nr:hypothetical protein [Edaphobacter sp.]